MKKVLLCFTMPHGGYIGGIASILNSYLKSKDDFLKNGYEIELFDYQNNFINKIKKISTKLYNIIYGIFQIRKLLQKIDKNKYDIIHIHTSCRYLFVKDVLILKILKRKIKNIKTVLSVHVGDINEVFKKIPNILKSTTIKNINENCDLVLLLSKEIESQFIDNGIDLSKIRVIANFHDLQIEDNLNVIKNDKEDKLNLLFVGSLQTDKGIFELLQAVEDLSKENIYLDICGKFPDNESYKMYSKIIHKSKNKINNNGYVSGNNKSQIFEKADVLILPSYHEGFPLVILEAIASGCAVISTKVGATPEILNDSNAIWVEKKSVSDIKNAILELITNRNKLNIMKLNNLILSKKYSKKTNINNVCKEYNKLING